MRKKTISFIRNIYTLSREADLFKKEVMKSKELTALYFGEVKTYGIELDPQFKGKVWTGFSADQIASHLSGFHQYPIRQKPVPIEENTNKESCKCD